MDAICRPIAVAPCSSDTHVMHGGAGPMKNRILDHECVAEVVEVGELIENFKPGDIVVVPCSTPDWEEPSLQKKGSNNAHDIGPTGSFKFVLQKNGIFADFFSVNNADANLVLLPEGVSIDAALIATDMMSTGFYGVEQAEIQLGDTVVVFRIGPVGLMAVAGAKLKGAGRIYAIGTRLNCVALAQEYGATDIISYKSGDIVEQILALEGRKVDAAIIAGGDATSMNQALQLVKNNGHISNVNFYDGSDVFNVPAYLWGLGMSDITIRGGFCPGGAYRMQKMLNLIKYGRIDPSKLLNVSFEGFDKIEDAFKLMDEKPKDLIKPVVHITWQM